MEPSATIICDLSEVLIPGLIGVEHRLSLILNRDIASIQAALGSHPFYEVGNHLDQLFVGAIGYDGYTARVLKHLGLDDRHLEIMHAMIVAQFDRAYDYTHELIKHLRTHPMLVLYSDHCPEWIAHIEAAHPFLAHFDLRIFSYELGSTKREARSFTRVLEMLDRDPGECVFIDDNERNVHNAASVGIDSIRFEGPKTAAELIARVRDRHDVR